MTENLNTVVQLLTKRSRYARKAVSVMHYMLLADHVSSNSQYAIMLLVYHLCFDIDLPVYFMQFFAAKVLFYFALVDMSDKIVF